MEGTPGVEPEYREPQSRALPLGYAPYVVKYGLCRGT